VSLPNDDPSTDKAEDNLKKTYQWYLNITRVILPFIPALLGDFRLNSNGVCSDFRIVSKRYFHLEAFIYN
jgi:hypothetical protein